MGQPRVLAVVATAALVGITMCGCGKTGDQPNTQGATPSTAASPGSDKFQVASYNPKEGLSMTAAGWKIAPVLQGSCVVTKVDPSYLTKASLPAKDTVALLAFRSTPKISAEGIQGDPSLKNAGVHKFNTSSTAGGFMITTKEKDYADLQVKIPAACSSHDKIWIMPW